MPTLWHLPLTYNDALPHELCDRHGDTVAEFRAFADGSCQHTPEDAQRCREAMQRINVHDELLAMCEEFAKIHKPWPATSSDLSAKPLVALDTATLRRLNEVIAKARG